MKEIYKLQKGFTITTILLVVALITVVTFAGVQVYSQRQPDTNQDVTESTKPEPETIAEVEEKIEPEAREVKPFTALISEDPQSLLRSRFGVEMETNLLGDDLGARKMGDFYRDVYSGSPAADMDWSNGIVFFSKSFVEKLGGYEKVGYTANECQGMIYVSYSKEADDERLVEPLILDNGYYYISYPNATCIPELLLSPDESKALSAEEGPLTDKIYRSIKTIKTVN